MEHDPSGEAATGGGGHVERGDDQVGALLLAHGVSEHSTRVRIAHGAQVDPALGAAQVGKIRDPHPVQTTLAPLAGAVVLMGHWTPSAAPAALGWAWVRVQACEALAAHRRGDRTHTHIHARASEHGGCKEPHRCRPRSHTPRPPPHPNAAAPVRASVISLKLVFKDATSNPETVV